jgi:AraC-like DNA-binding protein
MLYDATLNVEKICHLVGLSKTNLFTKLKALTGQSITLYIRKLRLAKSRELLTNPDITVAEVAYSVGFNDPKYFTRVFTEEYGESPKEAKGKK